MMNVTLSHDDALYLMRLVYQDTDDDRRDGAVSEVQQLLLAQLALAVHPDPRVALRMATEPFNPNRDYD